MIGFGHPSRFALRSLWGRSRVDVGSIRVDLGRSGGGTQGRCRVDLGPSWAGQLSESQHALGRLREAAERQLQAEEDLAAGGDAATVAGPGIQRPHPLSLKRNAGCACG